MRRAMMSEETTVLTLRQGVGSFMPSICFDGNFSYVCSGEDLESEWRMFPMIFGQGEKIAEYFRGTEREVEAVFEPGALLGFFSSVHVEAMETRHAGIFLSDDQREGAWSRYFVPYRREPAYHDRRFRGDHTGQRMGVKSTLRCIYESEDGMLD